MNKLLLRQLAYARDAHKRGDSWEKISKHLGRRKAEVMSQTKERYDLTSPRKFNFRTLYGEKRIPEGSIWERRAYTTEELGRVRRKRYPSWRYQFWLRGIFYNEETAETLELEGFSFVSDSPDEERMRAEAIQNAYNPIKGYEDAWILKKTLDEGWIQLRALKKYENRAPKQSHPKKATASGN